ncbi:hypothetical protein SAMN05660860_02385 [Geoalkalibacter ferrihydriticus]|uniref:Uncharacterized protein n=2 Tax=Geoalkalibacter ferrihydriticus TaxID=392333 RepID=A0A0C2EH12_9BACT|nr:hypothetical protein [Geoalkalibacter ferrihydriticus]KIH77958.1 hypothetical protein GFER_04945 [Geoalkalibacter ferrihydriticus DSM 17813]SDM35310.1 hypothetical protein SAMN05660860_02385 [Geoalkalibacter ferrihydriticus]
MTKDQTLSPMTEESVRTLLEEAGARVGSRGGRSNNYGAPREFSFEVRALFPNGLGLQVVARQYNYRDPWEAAGRVNDMVDVALLRDGGYSPLPRGYAWFQGRDEEESVDEATLREIIGVVRDLNPKIFKLQELTGDL